MESLYPVRLLSHHQYALVDRVSGTAIHENWPLVSLVPHGLGNEEHLLPALIPLQEMKPAQQADLLEMLEHAQQALDTPPIATFLASNADLEKMHLHWTKQLIVYLPHGSRALLRSYDPRVFMQLQWMFDPAQLSRLYGPIAQWTIYRESGWRTFHCPEAQASSPGRIHGKQAEQLARIGRINQVLDKLPASSERDHATVSRAIDALLRRAQAHRLLREEEQIAFAMHGMTVHPEFDHHPLVRRMIDEIDPDEQTYCDAAALLGESIWQKIASELNTSSHTKTS